ncbi:hypothetical protein [Bordetella sp. 2513F-2]
MTIRNILNGIAVTAVAAGSAWGGLAYAQSSTTQPMQSPSTPTSPSTTPNDSTATPPNQPLAPGQAPPAPTSTPSTPTTPPQLDGTPGERGSTMDGRPQRGINDNMGQTPASGSSPPPGYPNTGGSK